MTTNAPAKPSLNPELLDRLPPCDTGAEQATIASLLLDPNRLDEVGEIVRPEQFYAAINRELYRHLLAMDRAGKPIDTRLFVDYLKSVGDYDRLGGAVYLQETLLAVAVPHHAAYYARIVAQKATLRQLIHVGTDLVRSGYDPAGDPEEILDQAERELTAIGTDREDRGPVSMQAAVLEAIRQVEAIASRNEQAGLMTGLETFDRNLGGLFAGELFILAARPGVGKTSLGCQIAHHFGAKGRNVLFVSLEMGHSELAMRILASLSGVSSKRIRTARISSDDQAALANASGPLAEAAIWIYDAPKTTVSDIRRRARRMARNGLSLIVIDYLQRVTPDDPRANRYEQVGQISRGLKALARELNVPVLCMCQSGRDADKEEKPKLSWLRESGDIEADADVVAFLMVSQSESGDDTDPREAQLDIAKNRNGETGKINLLWIPYRTMFECIQPAVANRHEEFADYAGQGDF